MARVLILNSQDYLCGVWQYGKNLHEIVSKSQKHSYSHHSYQENDFLQTAMNYHDMVIVNWHEKLFPWLTEEFIRSAKIPVAFIGGHDCYPNFPSQAHMLDATSCNPAAEKSTPIPRPVRDFWPLPDPERVTIGSCGFNFYSKNFHHVSTVVADSYDDALIRLHIGQHPSGNNTEHIVSTIEEQLWKLGKPNINVEIFTEFLTDEELVAFLSSNTANVFLYPPFAGEDRGLSSTIDKALASKKPFGISDSTMYRHINHEEKFLLTKHRLSDIVEFGVEHIKPFWDKYSEKNLIKTVDSIVDKLCC